MKLSQVLKDWPEKMEELDETEIYNLMIEHFPELCPRSNETGMELQQGIKAIRKGKNFIKAISALTSCDREIDKEALAKALFEGEFKKIKWVQLEADGLKEIFYDRADLVISTMPTWLKRIEEK